MEGLAVMKLFNDIYKNKKILITGHTGFKGSWLSLWLIEMGAKVIGYSLKPSTNPSLFEVLNLKDSLIHIEGDIRDLDKLKSVFNEHKPDIVFHLAAQPLVIDSYIDPIETYDTNVMGTLKVFEAAKFSDTVKVIINVTTDKCYENKEWVYGYRETEPMGGYDPYSSSKGCSEILTASYRNSFFNINEYNIKHKTILASARAGNVIGGGDWSRNRLIPDIVKSLNKSKEIIIRNPKAIRPWQHVLEPLSGYLKLASKCYSESVKYSGGWNFGPNNHDVLNVEDVVKKSIEVWGEGNYVVNSSGQLHEASLLKLDISKANSYLKWFPVYDSTCAIEKTIKWYKSFYSNITGNIKNYSLKQVNEYVEAAIEKFGVSYFE